MIQIRKSDDRGFANHGWLRTHHTFSFADYFDRNHMGFRSLRVINEDWISSGMGFPQHGHRDMEIVTIVLEGVLAHRDTLGNSSEIRPGEIQRMSAGTGIEHSEANPAGDGWTHLYQIWILPDQKGRTPEYEQKNFRVPEGEWTVVASPDGGPMSVQIHQDVNLLMARIAAGEELDRIPTPGRYIWIQVIKGSGYLTGDNRESRIEISEGDGAAISGESLLKLEANESLECLLFDLA